MAGDRSPQPPREAWEAWKHDIHTWYLTLNCTCDAIQKTLEASGFKVTERQIKNKLCEWQFEQKKTPCRLYLAMLAVLEDNKAHNIEVQFSVPKREIRETYSGQKVKKECERVKKRLASRSDAWNLPSFDEAMLQLAQGGVVVEPRSLVMQQNSPCLMEPYGGVVPGNSPPHHHHQFYRGYPPKMHVDTTTPNADYLDSTHGRRLEDYSAAPNSAAPSFFTTCRAVPVYQYPYSSGTPSTVYTPEFIETPHSVSSAKTEPSPSNFCLSPATPVFFRDRSPSSRKSTRHYFADSRSLRRADIASSTSEMKSESSSVKLEQDPAPSHTRPLGYLRQTNRTAPFKRAKLSSSTPRPDFDFRGTIDSVSMINCEPYDEYSYSSEDNLGQDNSPEAHKLTASRWAAPYYMQCVLDVPEAALQRSKAQSMIALRDALEHSNEFILPCLSWTMLMLGQTKRLQQLADFLQASCKVIDEQTNFSESFTYATPFYYAWAWASNNEKHMDRYGDDLEASYKQIGLIWGNEHPNFFVTGYFYAWDLLRREKCPEAVRLLTKSLPVCETKMGCHDLLTINCLALVSRAYGEMKKRERAIIYLRKAIDSIQILEADTNHAQVHRPVLRRFRLSLLGRHADLKHQLHDLPSAEKQFWRALHLCSYLYGVESNDTWDAVYALKPVLKETGKDSLWEDLQDYINKGWAWAHNRKWFEEKGENAPPPPLAPPCWSHLRTNNRLGSEPCRSKTPRWEAANLSENSFHKRAFIPLLHLWPTGDMSKNVPQFSKSSPSGRL